MKAELSTQSGTKRSGEGGRQPEAHERGCRCQFTPSCPSLCGWFLRRKHIRGAESDSAVFMRTTGMGRGGGEEGILASGQRARPGVPGRLVQEVRSGDAGLPGLLYVAFTPLFIFVMFSFLSSLSVLSSARPSCPVAASLIIIASPLPHCVSLEEPLHFVHCCFSSLCGDVLG